MSPRLFFTTVILTIYIVTIFSYCSNATGSLVLESAPTLAFEPDSISTITSPAVTPARIVDRVRKALVIGNSKYPKGELFGALTNPLNDAIDIASSLSSYGFTVTTVLDADPKSFTKAIITFSKKLDRDDIALVYYSGHGFVTVCDHHPNEQRNYLVPVGKAMNNRADLCEYAISATWLLGQLNLRGGGTNILILDSCRGVLALTEDKGFETQGFTWMHGAGSFIGYAAEPGHPALGALGDKDSRHSLYTGKLLAALAPPYDDLPVQVLFMQVRKEVAEAANEVHAHQIPWSDDGLVGSFCFRHCRPLDGPAITQAELDKSHQENLKLEQENQRKDEELKRLREQLSQQPKPQIDDTPVVPAIIAPYTKPQPSVAADTTTEPVSSRYLVYSDGTVSDTKTNLLWKRCSEGQTWDGSTCSGKARDIPWNEAILGERQKLWPTFAGYNDWRLPTRDELKTLVYCNNGTNNVLGDPNHWCGEQYQLPTIETAVFPNIQSNWFWSRSEIAANPDFAWLVSFDDGLAYWDKRSTALQVRLVRAIPTISK